MKTGYRFGVYNGDAKGTVTSINTQRVEYTFDHAPEITHDHDRKWLNEHTYPLEVANG